MGGRFIHPSLKEIMTRLWELSESIKELENAIADLQDNEELNDDDRETQIEEIFIEWLETGESFKSKAEKVAGYIRHQQALAEARKNEARRLRNLADQAENQSDRLRRYLLNQMLLSGQTRINGVSVKIGLRKKQPRVLLHCDPSELPSEYVKIEYTPKLSKIRERLKADDEQINWAYLSGSHEFTLTIR